jgi:hypothetical protein
LKAVLATTVAATLAVISTNCVRQDIDTVRTSIRREDCTAPPTEVVAKYRARDLGVQLCPAPDMWRLLVVASDTNSWIDLTSPGGLVWSGERQILYESPIGNFPNIDSSAPAEWRRDSRGSLTALIFRVTAQDRDTLETTQSMLYVVRLQPDKTCVIGREITVESARALADSEKGCV